MNRPRQTAERPRLVVLTSASPESFPHLRKFPPVMAGIDCDVEYWSWLREPRGEQGREFPELKVLSTISARPRALLIVGYVWWIIRVFWAMLWSHERDVFLCERFESALPAAFVTLLRRRRYLFYNSDNLYLSHRWSPLMRGVLYTLEKFAAGRAAIHLVPSTARWPQADANRRLLPNWPSRPLADEARRIATARNLTRGDQLTVYVNGWLPETRGLRMIAAAAQQLLDAPLRFVVCGKADGTHAQQLLSLKNVEYMGTLPAAEALAQYYRCHVVLTFYDPAIEINRLAEPNKWFDCVVTGTPFITNDGVQTAQPFRDAGACLAVPYDDDAALALQLRDLAAAPARIRELSRNLSCFPQQFWDEQMEAIMRELVGIPREKCVAQPLADPGAMRVRQAA